MKHIEEKPSWADAPAWATHLLTNNHALGVQYGWAELKGGTYYAEPHEPASERVGYVVTAGGWRVVEARPAVPADDEPALEAGMESRTVYRAPDGMRMVPEGDVAELARLRLQTGGCGACGDACASRAGQCRLAEESPPVTATWADAERLVGFASVDEALTAFSQDSTGDNATCIVLAVLEAMSDICAPAAQKANLSLGFADTPLLVAELAMFIRIIASKVRNGRDATEVIGKALECQRQHGLGSPLRGGNADLPLGGKTDSQE